MFVAVLSTLWCQTSTQRSQRNINNGYPCFLFASLMGDALLFLMRCEMGPDLPRWHWDEFNVPLEWVESIWRMPVSSIVLQIAVVTYCCCLFVARSCDYIFRAVGPWSPFQVRWRMQFKTKGAPKRLWFLLDTNCSIQAQDLLHRKYSK